VPAPVVAVPIEYYKIPPPWAGQGHEKHSKKPKDK
jgi:hypothetical protein